MVVTNPAFLVAHFIQQENIFKEVGIRDITHFLLPSAEQPEWSLMWTALNEEPYKLKVCAFCIHMKKANLTVNRATNSTLLFKAIPLTLDWRQKTPHLQHLFKIKTKKNNQKKTHQKTQAHMGITEYVVLIMHEKLQWKPLQLLNRIRSAPTYSIKKK